MPDLPRIGAALYGSRWQSELARALGVNNRLVRHWTDGTRPQPADLPQRLAALAERRVKEIQEAVR